MKGLGPFVILLLAFFATLFSVIGEGGYASLQSLRQTLANQNRRNEALKENVHSLRREVTTLQQDDRALEKAARNELGLAAPDEIVVIFDDKGK